MTDKEKYDSLVSTILMLNIAVNEADVYTEKEAMFYKGASEYIAKIIEKIEELKNN